MFFKKKEKQKSKQEPQETKKAYYLPTGNTKWLIDKMFDDKEFVYNEDYDKEASVNIDEDNCDLYNHSIVYKWSFENIMCDIKKEDKYNIYVDDKLLANLPINEKTEADLNDALYYYIYVEGGTGKNIGFNNDFYYEKEERFDYRFYLMLEYK